MNKLLGAIFGVTVGGLFMCAGVALFIWDFGMMKQAADSGEWPEANGVVTVSTVEKHGKEFWPRVEYTYSVAGVQYTAHQISFDLFDRPGGRGLRDSILARYPVGQAVIVYHDPNNPAIAILEPENYSPFFAPLLFAAIPFGGGLVIVWAIYHFLLFGGRRPTRSWWEKMHTAGTAIVSLLIYSAFAVVSLESGPREVAIQAFGKKPLGIPNVIFVFLLQTWLFIPVPFVLWHGLQLAWQAHRDGERLGLLYLLTVGKNHPKLRLSQWVCIGGALYFFGVMAAWIVYTAILGI